MGRLISISTFTCPFCHLVFAHRSELEDHLRHEHPERQPRSETGKIAPRSVQRFQCDRCRAELAFTDARCPRCGVGLGYEPGSRTLQVFEPDEQGRSQRADGVAMWRCLNAAWGCNWLLPVDPQQVWCRSCRLTRGRPDTSDTAAVQAWMTAEAAKRRIVHQLDSIGLPLRVHSAGGSRELTFDLVHVPGEPEVTGHRDGIITLDLTEADELHRATQRFGLREAFRTFVGHIRHELGHFYLTELVPAGRHDEFTRLFGDEQLDYAAAVRAHYQHPLPDWRERGYITAYASAHPFEDWAESFAHYLAIRDGAETMVAYGAQPPRSQTSGWPAELAVWRDGVTTMNAVAEGLGQGPVYPIVLTDAVVEKLSFVDECVRLRVGSGTAGDAGGTEAGGVGRDA